MAPKSKKEKLQDETLKQLKDIKNRVDPRTYAAFERDIYNSVGMSALYKMQGKIEAIRDMEADTKYTKTAQAKQTNKDNKIKNKEVLEHLKKPLETFFVKANVELMNTYRNLRKSRYNKNGRKKGEMYENHFDKTQENDILKEIRARSAEEAEKLYRKQIFEEFDTQGLYTVETISEKKVTVTNISKLSITKGSGSGISPSHMLMRKYEPLRYNFIPADNKLLVNEGFCVPDVFVGTYSKYIKKLTLDYFIELCYEARCEDQLTEHKQNSLDEGLEEDDEEKTDKWNIKDGVSSEMLKKICKKLNISMYAFDITKKCFLKTIATHRNYPVFVFYAVSNHCYHITNPIITKSLVEQAKDIEHKIKSNCIIEEVIEKATVNNFVTMEIKNDIDIEKLNEHDNCIIIYSKNDLNEELDKIIELYQYIPKLYNHIYDVIYIHYDKDQKNIHLYVDPNDSLICDYKYIQSECKKLNLEFKNQSFTQMITQLKKRYFDNINKRHVFTQKERIELWKFKANNTCMKCSKPVKAKEFEIDHIKPIAKGGSNDVCNLQILCKGCHKVKTSEEQEQGYFKFSDTESSFNTVTKNIFESSLCGTYAFIESICNKKIPKSMENNRIYNIDINKCRKNRLYFNKFAYPLFTVMDKPEEYKGQTQTGLYYVETKQYFPFRGNGWYNYPLIKYGLENNLIIESEIKYVIISSLEVPANYYNDFIDYLYENVEESKLSVNAMIGNFKPKPREQWRSELITEDFNEAFYYYLKFKGSMIDVRKINDKNYYQIYSTTIKSRQETDAPLYKQILELEAIELHKLKTLIESKGGICLDLNTDCVSCIFKNDILPFKLKDEINLDEYYYDDKKTLPKYKLDDKDTRLQYPKMANYNRIQKYEHENQIWKTIQDISNNDFNQLIKDILDSKQSINIDGRAGVGKSTLIKSLQAEMTSRGIKYISVAPTNKAARVINGQTIHKFIFANSSRKMMTETKYEYVFVDEISMVQEHFYKFFITLKNVRPELKFIIAGDFEQLLPVNDRVECDYKTSPALFELCDGRRLQLSKCRRSDDTLFNMLNPSNICNIKSQDFKQSLNKLYMTNLCHTNKKRKEINNIMMEKYIKMQIDKAKESKKKIPIPIKVLARAEDETSQDVKLLRGMPIIAKRTIEKYDIMNNETFDIIDINEDTFKIIVNDSPIEIELKEFSKLFNIAFCMTIHKSQGQTFNHDYAIHEWNKLDHRLKYVALSRSTKIDNIYISV